MRLAIYGTGGMGRELLTPLRRLREARKTASPAHSPEWDDLVFVDDFSTGVVRGVPIVKLADLRAGDQFILAIGSSAARRTLEPLCLDKGLIPYSFEALTHLRDDDVRIGPGALLCDFTAITAATRIGRQFQCNLYAHVSHDCVIGDYVTLAPKACINGHVHIGDGAWIGAGAVIRNGTPDKPLVIGAGAVVGCGAVVVKDVPAGATVTGVPAR